MNNRVHIPLNANPEQTRRLAELQRAFAEVCNTLAPMVRQTRCWNRVALHHMAYKGLRQKYPGLGSQLICNAIYSVSRSSRDIYQHPSSPFNLARLGDKPLPLLHFLPTAPVYFDRHTLSIKNGQVSMFTLDGRLKFELPLDHDDERRFREDKLREIVLTNVGGFFALTFTFADPDGEPATSPAITADGLVRTHELPDYLVITSDDMPPPMPDRADQTVIAR